MCVSCRSPLTLEYTSEQIWLLLRLLWNKSSRPVSVGSYSICVWTPLFGWIFKSIFRARRYGWISAWKLLLSRLWPLPSFWKAFFWRRRILAVIVENSLLFFRLPSKTVFPYVLLSSIFILFLLLSEYGIALLLSWSTERGKKTHIIVDGFPSRALGKSAVCVGCSLFHWSILLSLSSSLQRFHVKNWIKS